ncbi:hypothetical protein FI667_g10858, partial [Globisporangium splendens]
MLLLALVGLLLVLHGQGATHFVAATVAPSTSNHLDAPPRHHVELSQLSKLHQNEGSAYVSNASSPRLRWPRIRYPLDGSVNVNPVAFRCEFTSVDFADFQCQTASALLCIEVDHKWIQCQPMIQTPPEFPELPAGNYTAVAFLTDREQGTRSNEPDAIAFTILTLPEYNRYVQRRKEQEREAYALPEEQDLLAWAASHNNIEEAHVDWQGDVIQDARTSFQQTPPDPLILLVGVKTSVISGFAQRQAIRSTWASASVFPKHAKLLLVECQSVLSNSDPHPEAAADSSVELLSAIEKEKHTYGGLLTHELACQDSYFALIDKVKAFVHFVVTQFPTAQYMMVADDDIYLRTDQLVHALRVHGPRTHVCAGQVWTKQVMAPMYPMRSPAHKNYLPEEQYPVSELPPFAFGPYYFMSMDCAAFIADSSDELRGLAALDDISIALWLLALQVHPEHAKHFQNLRDTSCTEGLISLADLSPSAIRIIRANPQANAPFCRGADMTTWLKTEPSFRARETQRKFTVATKIAVNAAGLQVKTTFTIGNAGSIEFAHAPSRESVEQHVAVVCEHVQPSVVPKFNCGSDVSPKVYNSMVVALNHTTENREINPAFLGLWTHNLQLFRPEATHLVPAPAAKIVVYSRNAMFSKTFLECLFASVYTHNPVFVVDDTTFHQHPEHQGIAPDVVVSLILGGSCGSGWDPPCRQAAAGYAQKYKSTSSLIMMSGEAWDVDGLDENVLLISTVAHVPRRKHIYTPVASLSFGERLIQSPLLLLTNSSLLEEPRRQLQHRKFCAYMHARCDRPQREYMFDLLNAMEPVDALGVCQGSSRAPNVKRWTGRSATWYNDDVVQLYSQY